MTTISVRFLHTTREPEPRCIRSHRGFLREEPSSSLAGLKCWACSGERAPVLGTHITKLKLGKRSNRSSGRAHCPPQLELTRAHRAP